MPEERSFRIDFFHLAHTATGKYPAALDGFLAILDGSANAAFESGGYYRDIYALSQRKHSNSWTGQFRKFRVDDLPEVAELGGTPEELALEEGQGLVERNFFVYYQDYDLIGWHVNSAANHPAQLQRFLVKLWGCNSSLSPVLQKDAIARLMRRDAFVKKIVLTIPRPKNPELYPDDDYSRETMALMSGVKADSMHIELSIDGRRKDSAGKLAHKAKRALAELVGVGATTARAIVQEDGVEHPVDLIADRITSTQVIEFDGRYPPALEMHRLIDAARHECEEAIRGYFGEVGSAMR